MDHTPEEASQPVALNEEDRRPESLEPLTLSSRRLWLHAVLFTATVFTTLLAGALQQGVNPLAKPWELVRGIPFSFTLMAILLTHEMGHYLTSRRHGVMATLPYFIPAPSIIGTFGAFIRMTSPIMHKRALLDIGASGPIAGFVVSIIAVAIGLRYSQVIEAETFSGLGLGAPLIFQILSDLIVGPLEKGYDILLHPIAFAGWIGLFVTALNLIPIGQLDGGHVVYAIFGERHRILSLVMVPILIVMGFFGWPGWYLWALLPLVFGIRHPPIVNPDESLDGTRKVIGWATLVIFVITFTPVPFFST
ncbi:MAG TPA: site-2 protease family protein [Nitrospiria bacterium]|nr:site-2 protease family protein [Nitrospiria bacterium]